MASEDEETPSGKLYLLCCCCCRAPVQRRSAQTEVSDDETSVNAPVLPENTVTVNYYGSNEAGKDHQKSSETAEDQGETQAPVQMSRSTQTEVSDDETSVNAPLLPENTVTGNNYGSNEAGNDHQKSSETAEKQGETQEADPKTWNVFLKYSHRITADPDTAHELLRLSEGNTVITNTNTDRSYPDHPDRFDYLQVLCRERVSDRRCYWEIEWSGNNVSISVSYKSISRKGKGKECRFGSNDQSWSLECSPSKYSFRHNNTHTDFPVKPIISRTVNKENHYRIGVYVDHSAGSLFFYSVSEDTVILIHRVQTTFTKPLYPGFGVYYGSSVKLC